HRAARKTQHSASAAQSTEDLGEGHVIEPGRKTQECFHANDASVTLPSRSRREFNDRFLGTTFSRPTPVEAAVGGVVVTHDLQLFSLARSVFHLKRRTLF